MYSSIGNYRNCVPHFIKCSFWITVFVVRVGCIIEVRAAGSEIAPDSSRSSLGKPADAILQTPDSLKGMKRKTFDLRTASSRSLRSSRSTTTSTTTPVPISTTTLKNLDTCSTKEDGYYPNFESDCTSYYFCAAGYQITYVCPPGRRFNGDKCAKDYECPSIGVNSCENFANGYYPMTSSPQKYFYCFHKAKVIELSCDGGKVFDGIWKKCISVQELEERAKKLGNDDDTSTCVGKPNGFYLNLRQHCQKYYYCVRGEKTELECGEGLLFNGDVCVQKDKFQCPVLENSKNRTTTTTPDDPNGNSIEAGTEASSKTMRR